MKPVENRPELDQEYEGETCPNCNSNSWFCIPDSLAQSCKKCGFVRVLGDVSGKYIVGKTLQQWAKDLYEAK